ncbi:Heparin lyase [Bacteroides heparinolyticus]|uniref:Heparin lyase n=1 Tax=Prevotella heparinolytica TaxID=28113 RepID=A0A449I501_9BACE|nr:heparin lyase I family protein [Bacteroides heparinolyticus]VFB14504.1 Heparin lyase [Bacteroides heparinolyticus]
MRNTIRIAVLLSFAITDTICAQSAKIIPLTERVNVQADSARTKQIIDNRWVAVGTNKPHTIQSDYSRPFQGKPSYRFELKQEDNTLEGYAKGETKGRAELCYCYAVADDFRNHPEEEYHSAQKMKTVYHYGKGSCPQGASMSYTFSVYISRDLDQNVSTIFAQWHGMPSRTLVSDPSGKVMRLSVKEFLELEKRMIFKKDTAHDKIAKVNAQGDTVYKAGKPNGWLIEQGGYPPLAFGFSQGYFYIKANSDRKWLTDKTDRCNANPDKAEIMKPVTSAYKASTIAYKIPFEHFPKDCWVTFRVNIDWTLYGKEKETVLRNGLLDVTMSYRQAEKEVKRHIVNNEKILIGRNDEEGYYFKFGIYRVGNSTTPVCYNLAGYEQHERNASSQPN